MTSPSIRKEQIDKELPEEHAEDQSGDAKPVRLSDAVWLAGLTALGYLIAYSYEAGFFVRLGIPLDLIHITTSRLIASVAVTASAFTYAVPALVSIVRWANTGTAVRMVLGYLLLVGGTLGGLALVFGYRSPVVLTVGLLLVSLVVVLLLVFSTEKYLLKAFEWKADPDTPQALVPDPRSFDLINGPIVKRYSGYVVSGILIAGLMGAYNAGAARRWHTVTIAGRDYALLRAYENQGIVAPFDPTIGDFQPSFGIVDLKREVPLLIRTSTTTATSRST